MAFEAETKAGITENRHFLSAGGQVFAIYKTFSGPGAPAPQMRYLHSEVMGSVTAVTNEPGAIAERTVFDPWGKRQFLNGTPDLANTLTGTQTDRGYTGHEHVDEVGFGTTLSLSS